MENGNDVDERNVNDDGLEGDEAMGTYFSALNLEFYSIKANYAKNDISIGKYIEQVDGLISRGFTLPNESEREDYEGVTSDYRSSLERGDRMNLEEDKAEEAVKRKKRERLEEAMSKEEN